MSTTKINKKELEKIINDHYKSTFAEAPKDISELCNSICNYLNQEDNYINNYEI